MSNEGNQGKQVILLVDDNEEIVQFISDDLEERYTILTAGDGEEALQVLNREVVHLVVSDIMMPVMDGYELCAKVKSNFEYCHIPFVLLSAKNALSSKIEGLELGADAYIEKPFSPEYLQAQIANLLQNRTKIREYFASSPLMHIKSMAHNKSDEAFLEKLNDAIYSNIENVNLDVEHLAGHMNMSRPTLYRKIKAISDLTPHELINIARLKKAAELLVEGDYRIYEVSEMVGYSSQTHFGRNFLKQFGMTPTDYIKKQRE
jgi:two-component system, cell cycle response regulator